MGTMMKSPRSDRDRISNLPDPVIHHILSFLEMQELANFSLTSKKLREFCISIPFLTFDGFLWEDRGLKGELINYMDRLFAVRKGMETQRITIRWPFAAANADEKFRVVTWLYNAIACKVQLLHLEILLLNREDVFSLPLPVFHCESLKELKVDLDGGILDKFPLSDGHDISIDQNLTRLLHSICTSRTLILAYECNKILFKQGCLPSLFCNLSCLLVDTINLNDDLVPAIACFLKGTPNLKTLHIKNKNCLFADELTKLKSNSYAFTIRYWESQNLAFVHQLEEATIELFDKGDNELELIKYLLKHARTLKRMTILYSSSFPSVFNREVDDYRKASTAEIVYIYI